MNTDLFEQAIKNINFDMDPAIIRRWLREIWFDGRTVECAHNKTFFTYISKEMSKYEDKQDFIYEVQIGLKGQKVKTSDISVIEILFNKKDGFFCWSGMTKPPINSYLLGPVYAIKTPLSSKSKKEKL